MALTTVTDNTDDDDDDVITDTDGVCSSVSGLLKTEHWILTDGGGAPPPSAITHTHIRQQLNKHEFSINKTVLNMFQMSKGFTCIKIIHSDCPLTWVVLVSPMLSRLLYPGLEMPAHSLI